MKDKGGEVLKVDIINDTYSQLRISGITTSPVPEELELALTRLEDMAAEFHTRNMSGNYNFEDEPDPNSTSGIMRGFKLAYATNLAIRLIPDFGKVVPQRLIDQAAASASNLAGRTALVRQVAYPSRHPRGSGSTQRSFRWTRFYHPQRRVPLSDDSHIMWRGEVDDFIEHFDAYLIDNEVLKSFTIIADAGLVIESSSSDTTDVMYRVNAVGTNTLSGDLLQQIKIVATTDRDRVETRFVNFQVRIPDIIDEN